MSNETNLPAPQGQFLIYADGASQLQVRLEGNTVWLTQKLISELYGVTVPTVNEHLAGIYEDGELNAGATIRSFRIVQREGTRDVSRNVEHYSLDAILAVGYRVRSARGTAFRQWATARLSELLVKGFTMDDERIKAGRTLGTDYFDELLARIRDIGDAVDAGEVIDLFAVAGLDAARLDILSEDFLNRVSALEQKNLALETLRKLLTDQIKISERTNLVRAQKFREALEKAMLGYTNKQITTAEMIAKLLELAKWVREAKQHGQDLGLSTEEVAFYDALAENGSAKEVMQSDKLRLMARELAEMVKKMPKLDWTQRESVRADLRRNVRRLLAKYGYQAGVGDMNEEGSNSGAVEASRFGVVPREEIVKLMQTKCV